MCNRVDNAGEPFHSGVLYLLWSVWSILVKCPISLPQRKSFSILVSRSTSNNHGRDAALCLCLFIHSKTHRCMHVWSSFIWAQIRIFLARNSWHTFMQSQSYYVCNLCPYFIGGCEQWQVCPPALTSKHAVEVFSSHWIFFTKQIKLIKSNAGSQRPSLKHINILVGKQIWILF